MRIDVRPSGAVKVLDVRADRLAGGEGDVLLGEALGGLLAAGEFLFVVNLSRVSDIDSRCLGELVVWRERIRRRDGVMKLVLGPSVRELLSAARLDYVFEVFHDEGQALDTFVASTETAGIP